MTARGDEGRHPESAVLETFLRGDLPARQSRDVLAHLLRGCTHCGERMEPTITGLFRPGRSLPAADTSEYDLPIERALAKVQGWAAETAAGGPVRLRVLPGQAPAPPAPADDRARCEALLEASQAAQHRDPRGAADLARLAAEIADQLAAAPGTEAGRADFQARAWADLGNACRIAGELREAERAFDLALARAAEGSGDPLLLARIMDLTASLYTSQRRFREALRLLDGVRFLYEKSGERHLAGRALISQGISLGYGNDLEAATYRVTEGLARIDPRAEPGLALSAVHGLLVFTVESGAFAEARKLIAASRPLYESRGDALDRLKLAWLEARVAAGSGDPAAEAAFREVRAGFVERQLPYEAAIVSLDLAALWLPQGRTAEIVDLVEETLSTFRALEIRREAIAAMLVLRRALERHRVSAELLRTVAGRLRRLDRGAASLVALEA